MVFYAQWRVDGAELKEFDSFGNFWGQRYEGGGGEAVKGRLEREWERERDRKWLKGDIKDQNLAEESTISVVPKSHFLDF